MSNVYRSHKTIKYIFSWLIVFLVVWEDEPYIKPTLCNVQTLFGLAQCHDWIPPSIVAFLLTGMGYIAEKKYEYSMKKRIIQDFLKREEQLGGWWLYGLVDFHSHTEDLNEKISVVGFFHMKHEPGAKDVYSGHAFEYRKEDAVDPISTKRGTWHSLSVFEKTQEDKVLHICYDMTYRVKGIADIQNYIGIIMIERKSDARFLIDKSPEWGNVYCGEVRAISEKHFHHGWIYCVQLNLNEQQILNVALDGMGPIDKITSFAKRDAHKIIKNTEIYKEIQSASSR